MVDVVARHAAGRTVSAVGVEVGARSGVVTPALETAWPVAIAHTPLDGAALEITEVPAAVWCPSCTAEVPIDEFFALTCPRCGTPTADVRRGQKFQVTWVDVE